MSSRWRPQSETTIDTLVTLVTQLVEKIAAHLNGYICDLYYVFNAWDIVINKKLTLELKLINFIELNRKENKELFKMKN